MVSSYLQAYEMDVNMRFKQWLASRKRKNTVAGPHHIIMERGDEGYYPQREERLTSLCLPWMGEGAIFKTVYQRHRAGRKPSTVYSG